MNAPAEPGLRTRVLIVEDHTLVRESLVKSIGAVGAFDVVGEAARGDDAFAMIMSLRPDVVLLDISMPGMSGLDVAALVKKRQPAVRILFLTMYEDGANVARALDLGADGYILKTASMDELLNALRAVAAGGSYLAPQVARRVIHLASGRADERSLTQRELEILRLLSHGSRPVGIAERLFLSVKTVKNHLGSIYAKLGVHSDAQAVAEAYRLGLVAPERVS